MINDAFGKGKNRSLMGEYSALLGDAVLRQRTRAAEHSARLETELANRVKSEFIANMSHELRTPLNTIIGFSKILSEHDRRRLPQEEIVEYATLINDILDISKIQSGKFSIDARETSIDEILRYCRTSFQKQAFDAGVALELSVAAPLPPVRGDSTKLRQAICNVISNAIKFTPNGGRVQIEGTATVDGAVAVTVADSGVGMSDEEIDVALTPFGQVDGGRTRWREGAGLGLPIARALVDLHGGRIDIRSRKGEGTSVTILLPSRHDVSAAKGRDMIFGELNP
ncbi:MAG: HAMP domain-containing histidine kinase [Hyphomicrobiaceae bacterium]|nr:HAMP domain-containing histidine kinase [Hyphomicrobiaceae bacterium]